ncbi:MAG: FecR domain-containing protein [Candidatus Lambdaproteobacteria bacterium]|nr:FecR domain-containing protein [Candidatus Lambdaproteobacteria bacterium]
MKNLIRTAILLMILMPAASLFAATKYGEAIIEQGKMTVLREGQRMSFTSTDGKTAINHSDVIRVGDNSRVVLETSEKATVTLGSNAVMQVEPWETRSDKGVFRMLFGRARSKIVGLVANERFNMRTATATIGVKGSGHDNTVNAQGITVHSCTEHECLVTGRDGVEKLVPAGFVVVALITGTTPPVPNPGLNTGLDEDPDEAGGEAVGAGIVTQDQLDESNTTDVDINADVSGGGEGEGGGGGGETIVNQPQFDLEGAVQAGASQKVNIDVRFEK